MKFNILDKQIGENNPVFIIAELSANHLKDFELAVKTIKAMKESGADAVKLQTYTPDTITIDSNQEYFQIKGGPWDGETLYSLYEKAYTPWDWQPKLKAIADDLGLIFFSSPFDETAVDFLAEMDVPAYKIASLEITDIPLIKYVAQKGKPIILSTGVASLDDISEAIKACQEVGNDQIALLKCTSQYPTSLSEVNLKTICTLKQKFKKIVGLSDHTLGTSVAIASVTLGSQIVEKHFTLDRKLKGPDAFFSLEPQEFSLMVKSIREVERALGEEEYVLTEEMRKAKHYCRSLFVVKDLKKGEILTKDNIRSIRPGNGLSPRYFYEIIGKKALRDIKKGTPLQLEDIEQ